MSNLGERIATLAFEGHKKRKRVEEFERESMPRNLGRAWEAAKQKFELQAERTGVTDTVFTFSCADNEHWFPESGEVVLDALPEEVQELRRDPCKRGYQVSISAQPWSKHAFAIRICVGMRTEELIAEAERKSEASGEPYW
jgi:hypothetical protein